MKEQIEKYVEEHPAFSIEDVVSFVREEDIQLGESTLYKILKQLCDEGVLTHAGRGWYVRTVLQKYHYDLTNEAEKISAEISEAYPLIDFQIWELYQLNEFVNHQIAHNTIFIDVEGLLDEPVFVFLSGRYPHVLFRPSYNEYYRYGGDDTLVVQKMISEAPPAIDGSHVASLEKILVDLFAKGIQSLLVPLSEYNAIYEDCFKKYVINTQMMFRYARRRGCEKKIREFIQKGEGL